MKRVLRISDAYVTTTPIEFTCYGLGSCIGLFISDRVNGISGGAHIPLPEAMGDSNFLHAHKMIEVMMKQFSDFGSDLLTLRAKVTGGAKVLESEHNIGKQNIDAVIRELTDRKVFIAALDVGGKISRTARFNSKTGELQISTSEQKKYFI